MDEHTSVVGFISLRPDLLVMLNKVDEVSTIATSLEGIAIFLEEGDGIRMLLRVVIYSTEGRGSVTHTVDLVVGKVNGRVYKRSLSEGRVTANVYGISKMGLVHPVCFPIPDLGVVPQIDEDIFKN